MNKGKISAKNFMRTIAANIDNEKLSDKDLRDFIRNTLPIIKDVEYPLKKRKDNDNVR